MVCRSARPCRDRVDPVAAHVDDGVMSLLFTVQVPNRPVEHLETVVGGPRYARLRATAAEFRRRLGGRRIWNVNSTAVGGGVAEMLQALGR